MAETAVLDLRSRSVRTAFHLWSAWEERPGPAIGILAAGTSLVRRRLLARRRRRRARPEGAPLIVSIGNLRVGGAGKTPVVIALAGELAARGTAGAVLCRGYGSPARGPLVVRPDDPRAADEARLIAARLPGWRVVQARDRAAGLALALEPPAPRVVLLEDGHQSAAPGRHLDVLVLDRWRRRDGGIEPEPGLALPWGPYREGMEGALAADVWLVEEHGRGGPWRGGPDGRIPVLTFQRRAAAPPGPLPSGPYAALSGIARPERFEADCARLAGRPPRLAVRCDDHCRYGRRHLERALAAGRRLGVAWWLTTEKDLVKLAGLWPPAPPLLAVRLVLEWTGTRTLPELVGERLGRGTWPPAD